MDVRYRNRLTAAAGVSALALAATGAALLPAQAAFAAPPQPLTVTVGNPAGNAPLLPGGRAETFTVTVKNDTSAVADYVGGFIVAPQGVLALSSSDVALSVSPIHAPATVTSISTLPTALTGTFGAKSGAFAIPAHGSYSWRIGVAATKAWPLNDNGLSVGVYQNSRNIDFKVGAARTGGPLVATVSGGDYLSPTHPMVETLTLTNRTGAALREGIWRSLSMTTAGSDTSTLTHTDIKVQTWQGGRWVAWTDNNLGNLKGLAKGASASVTVRFQLVGQTMAKPVGHIKLVLDGGINGALPSGAGNFALAKTFAVHR